MGQRLGLYWTLRTWTAFPHILWDRVLDSFVPNRQIAGLEKIGTTESISHGEDDEPKNAGTGHRSRVFARTTWVVEGSALWQRKR